MTFARRTLGLAGLLGFSALGCARSTSTDTPPATAAAPAAGNTAITEADLRARMSVYADDSMLGREAGTIGNVKATDYIAAELRRMGLQPAGENGTYFQTVPLVERGPDPAGTLSVGGVTLSLRTDYVPVPPIEGLPFGSAASLDGVTSVYAGRLGDSVSLTPEQTAGKLVVVGAPLGPDGQPRFALAPQLLAPYANARAIALVMLDLTPPPIVDYLMEPQALLKDDAPAPTEGRPVALFVSNAAAERLMGKPVADLAAGATGGAIGGRVAFVEHPAAAPARNVVAVLPGSDPLLRGQYVAIGAHNDHVGMAETPVDHDSLRAYNAVVRPGGAEDQSRPPTAEEAARIRTLLDSARAARPARLDSIFNGADDDGSGSVSVLAMAQSLAAAKEKPKRSILFVWHTAEEKGLFGASWFTDHPTVPRDSIVAQLNIDMIGRGGPGDVAQGGPGYIQLIGSRRLSTELGDLVETVNTDRRHGFTFDYAYDADGHPANYYCRSDHYMYARYGIPIVFFSTGGHRDYHQLTDEAEYIDFTKMARVATLIRDIGVRVANLDHRVVVDKPRPDPNGACQQ